MYNETKPTFNFSSCNEYIIICDILICFVMSSLILFRTAIKKIF